ncbi:class I SAM-dependent methyltransferase [Paracoccaceae bacterium GXU_MW_L88]
MSARLALAFEDPPEGPVLALMPRIEDLSVLAAADVTVYQPLAPAFQAAQGAGLAANEALPAGEWPVVFVFGRKARAEFLALIGEGWRRCALGGRFYIDAPKTLGIDAIIKQLRKRVEIADVTPKAHGKLVEITKSGPDDLFDDWIEAAKPRPGPEGFLTAPGLFSPEKIDPGSARLAEIVGEAKGRVLDLGAGWGYLAKATLGRETEAVHLVDADARALDLARQNLIDPRAHFHWADAATFTSNAPFDTILSNPPFHQDRASDISLGQSFITTAARLLARGGTAYFVANRHLPYEKVFEQAFAQWRILDEEGGFKIVSAQRPKGAR